MDINIDALYNILKQNQGDVNDAIGYKKKSVMVTSDPLEGHFAKDCKKAKVKDYNYYKTKMLLANKDSDEKVLLTKDQAWMESSSDSYQEISANMVFMAKMEKVFLDSEKSSSSAEETIAELSYYSFDSERESKYETSEYYDNSTNYAKELRPSLYDERVIGLGYTPMFLTYSDEALEIKKFKRARENKIEFAYDYGNLNESYVNEKINFLNDYFQEIINLDFKKIDSPFQQTSSLKPYVSTVNLEKIIIDFEDEMIIIDLEDEVVNLLEKEKATLETIESLKSKGFESSETAISESENQNENDCKVVEKECDKMENSKVIALGMFKLSVSQSISPISMSKTSCESNNVESRNYSTFFAARTPQQNGVVERRNRTLDEAARTMFTFASLPLFLCYLLIDYDDVGKLKAKGDIGVFIRYLKESAAFRIYNKRTRKIHESMNVNFDEISQMASKQFSLEPILSNLNEMDKSSNKMVTPVSKTSKKDLKDLFHDFYDEYFDALKVTKSPTTNVETFNEVDPSHEEEVFHEIFESFQEDSTSSSLNNDVHQISEEVKVPSSNTQSVSNNMGPNVNKANLDTFSSVRRPKNGGVIWKKKGSSNTSNVGLTAVSVSNLNKNVKRYSHKDLLACNNSHLGETSSASVCDDVMNVSCNPRMCDLLDDNNFFIFDDESVKISPVSKMPFRKNPRDSMHVRSKSNMIKSLHRTVHKWLPKLKPLAEHVAKWFPRVKRCSKHMTGNRALLTNFVEKFLGTVPFGNNDFAVIAG
nr:hypothetical protein [Tanacetum cinerariifolium]